jgi:hypothetical protein
MHLQFIPSHGYRINQHIDGSCTVFIVINNGTEVSYHLNSLEQARKALGY